MAKIPKAPINRRRTGRGAPAGPPRHRRGTPRPDAYRARMRFASTARWRTKRRQSVRSRATRSTSRARRSARLRCTWCSRTADRPRATASRAASDTAGNGERRRRGAGCSRGAGTRATCYGMRATAGRGVATPRRRAVVHRRPPGARTKPLCSRSEKSSPQRLVARIESRCGGGKCLLVSRILFAVCARRVPRGGPV